jgi:SAM-dependent methyltransferase
MAQRVTRLPFAIDAGGSSSASLPGISAFLQKYPQRASRLRAALPGYLKLFREKPPLINEAILLKLTNPDQTIKSNQRCAFNFADPQRLRRDYARSESRPDEDLSIVRIHPELMGNFINNIPPGSSVFSLGFGDGELERKAIKEKSCRVRGVDFQPEKVRKAVEKGMEAICGEIHGTLSALQEKYPIVVLSEVLGDLDAHLLFGQVKRFLTPEGKILLSTYLPVQDCDGTGYERHWSRSLEAILAQEGLEIFERKVWRIRDEEMQKIEPVEAGLDVEDGYVFYVIGRRRV